MTSPCNTCKKYITHGGNCQGPRRTLLSPCLMFEKDERGYVATKTLQIELGFGMLIPPLITFDNDWEYNNNPIKFYRLEPLRWDMKRCVLICEARADIFEPIICKEEPTNIITKIIKFKEVKQ
ncbi:MAG: hypothetical protein LLF94_12465 [Chlamydiales bacterium]|nr:hypothetical protein [Chlamydiales bacterium]